MAQIKIYGLKSSLAKNAEALSFATLGMGPSLNILFVVHCEQSANSIRNISARKADKKKTKFYFQGLSYE